MPLDTGGFTELPPEGPDPALADPPAPSLQSGASIGDALRTVRLDLGRSLDDLAEATRVRRAYLQAIEEMRLEALPSRPFTIGYIRAYAIALGLDPEAAVERFKAEEPVLDEPLRAPVGLLEDKDPRVGAFVAVALVIVAAIVLWNVAQRAMMASAPPPPKAPDEFAWEVLAEMETGPVALGAPLPAPVESTIPPLYEPPGLAEAGEDGRGNLAPPANIYALPETPLIDISTLPASFEPKGRIYGAENPQLPSVVTLQAIKGAALIVRGADGSVYFARQLAPGEAYRVPQVAGLTLDVSDPHDLQVFVRGQSKGVLPAAQVAASKLAG